MLKNQSFFHQFCFVAGLAGASYYSYGAVQNWFHEPETKPAVIEKQEAVSNQLEIQKQAMKGFTPVVPQQVPFPAAIPTAEVPVAEGMIAMDAPLATPEEKKDDGSANPESQDSVAEGFQPAFPQPYVPTFAQLESVTASDESKQASNESRDPSSVPQVSPSALTGPAALNSNSVMASGSSATIPQTTVISSLNGNEINALQTDMMGSFPAGNATESGALCEVIQQSCTYQNSYSVNSRSWAMQKILDEDVNFAVQKNGQALNFFVGFKVLTNSNVEENVNFQAVPTSVQSQQLTVNGTQYRHLNFTFPNMQIHGEPVKNVKAKLIYEVTPGGLELTNQSSFSFQRNEVTVDSAPDPVTQVVSPDYYFTAEKMDFSIKVEKLQ